MSIEKGGKIECDRPAFKSSLFLSSELMLTCVETLKKYSYLYSKTDSFTFNHASAAKFT